MIQTKLKNYVANFFAIVFSLIICLFIANIIFIKVSSQKIFPRSLTGSLPDMMQTFNPKTYYKDSLQNYTAIIGGSYAQGGGDAYLGGEKNYSIAHHLHKKDSKNYLIFGRAGSGPISAVSNLIKTHKQSNLPNLIQDLNKPSAIIYLYYEGYDPEASFLEYKSLTKTNENLNQFISRRINENIELSNFDILENILPLIPFIKKLYQHLENFIKKIINERDISKIKSEIVKTFKKLFGYKIILNKIYEITDLPNNIISNKFKINSVPPIQGAAPSLDKEEILISLNIFFKTIEFIKSWSQSNNIIIVYIPSPMTSYLWKEPIAYEFRNQSNYYSYKMTTNKENELKSNFIRSTILNYTKKNYINFLDLTDLIIEQGEKEVLHGPLDWHHFNYSGYKISSNYIKVSLFSN